MEQLIHHFCLGFLPFYFKCFPAQRFQCYRMICIIPAQHFQCYRMICIIAHIHDNLSGSILEFLKSFRLCFTEHIPYFTAVIEIWADNSIINGSVCLSTKSFKRLRAEIPDVIFLQKISVLLFHDKCWSTVTLRVLHSCTCLILLFSITTFGWKFEIFLTICFEPISINSVFATLRLSLLAISHFLRFSKSEITAASRSVTETPEAVRFVSLANNHGFVFDKHWGKSLIGNKKNMVLK